MTPALEACAARNIVVEQWAGDAHGNVWRATVPRHGRAANRPPLVRMVAPSADEAARMALRYVGARGWQQ